MEDDLLALERRRRLYQVVLATPGLSAREIQRAAGTAWGETVYHLDRLEGSGFVHREQGPHQDFYFAPTVPLGDRTVLRLARSTAVRGILVTLIQEPQLTLQEVADRAAISLSRASIHLRRLLDTALVVSGRRGNLRTFAVGDRERVARVLVAYREGYADDAVERLVDTWAALFPP